jgi:hypothetical protein
VLLSIALLATDLVVAAAGHRHEHAATAERCDSITELHAHGDMCHSHRHSADSAKADDDHRGGQSPGDSHDSHDDCSICRHVSQPIAPVTIELPQLASGSSLPAICFILERIAACLAAEHPARGPPVFRA